MSSIPDAEQLPCNRLREVVNRLLQIGPTSP